VIYQEGTYAPGTTDGIHRWMGSMAMDGSGNIAFGYSASDATSTFPSVWYTGRLASDPLGQMTLGEGSIVNGTGSQTTGPRWGDYTSLTVDPVDDCTFWYVNEWLPVSGGNWTLRIGAFKFDECGSPDFTLSVAPPTLAICTPDDAVYAVTVGQVQGYTDPVTLDALGEPAGTTVNFSTNPVTPPGSSTLTIGNTGAAAAGNYSIDVVGVAATSTHTATVALDVYTAVPGAPTLTSPADGATDVPLQPTFTWEAVTGAASYFIEIATDAGFTNIVDSATVSGTAYTPAAPLADGTPYYWRVTAANTCGDGAASTTFSFTTVDFAGVCNPTLITINDAAPATPYPSNITVAGYGNELLDLNVQLFGLSHTYPDDIDMLLVGPQGQNLIFMSDAGGSTDVVNVDLILDDAAATALPDSTAITTGTYRPANYGAGDTFPAPAPVPSGATTLATFNGSDPNGTWSLYVLDDLGADVGSIAGGWCLELAATSPAAPSIQVSPDSLSGNQTPDTVVTHTLTISNVGDADLNWDLFEDQSGTPLGGWSDNFDSYPTGQNLHGVGGWKGWDNSPAATAFTSAAQALSVPNSVDITGPSDLVHPYTGYTTGQWVYTAWQYIPNSLSGISYFLLLNTYNDGGPYNWSAQVNFNGATDQLTNDGVSGGTSSIVYDQWVEIRVEIDLDADTQDFYYNNQLLYAGTWTGEVSGGGAVNIATVDLYANNASSVFYDDISLAPPTPPVVACDAPEDITWLAASPTNGTTGPGSSDDVAVSFDSTGLSAGVYTGTLCVTSDDATNPLVSVPLTLTVEALVYGVSLSGADAASGLPGDTVSYVVTLTNTGNTADTFDLTATGVWTPTLSDASVALGAGEVTTFTVNVPVPAEALAGNSDVATVTATSQGDGTAADTTLLTTTAAAVYGVALSAAQTGSGAPGETVSYVITLTNTGNASDTLALSLSGNTWTATLSDASLTLAAGASATFTVDVTIPAGAADGDFDTTSVTATSQADASASDSTSLTTTAAVSTYPLFLPIMTKN
jgi:subtilisin-like proprotein convertase family protein